MTVSMRPLHVQHRGNENDRRILMAFWLMGLLNNTPYVIVLAGAKSLSEGSVGLVFLSSVLPSLLVKASAPYWFHLTSYTARLRYAAPLAMSSSFWLVSYFVYRAAHHGKKSLLMQMLGICLGSAGSGLGEASLLALAGRASNTDSTSTITAFSSGTGVAGVFGYFFMLLFNNWLSLSFSTTLLIGSTIPIFYSSVYNIFLRENVQTTWYRKAAANDESEDIEEGTNAASSSRDGLLPLSDKSTRGSTLVSNLSTKEKALLVVSLWKYMVPLFAVYSAEYAMQSGTWTAIGFPVQDIVARKKFYQYSNWVYQSGVLVSRSSGSIYQASLPALWSMAFIQVANLVFFYWIAVTHVWYNWWLLSLCFVAGLLGGGVYVNAFTRINNDIMREYREFCLASASLADSLGIVLADISGLFIQSCLYKANDITGSTSIVSCPFK